MQRALTFVYLLAIAACASGSPASGPETTGPQATDPQATTRGTAAATAIVDIGTVVDSRNALALVRHSDIAAHAFSAEPEVLWPRLVEVFSELELPITSLSTRSRLVGSQNERLRRIGRQSISRFFECPGTGYGNTASTEFVVVTIVGQIVPAAEGASELHLATAATSKASGRSEARCRSTGLLERRIREALAQASAGGGS